MSKELSYVILDGVKCTPGSRVTWRDTHDLGMGRAGIQSKFRENVEKMIGEAPYTVKGAGEYQLGQVFLRVVGRDRLVKAIPAIYLRAYSSSHNP